MKSKNRKSRKRMDFVDFTFIAELLICISVIWWIFAIFGPIMETIEFPTNGYAMIIGYSTCLAISVLLFRQFYLMRTEKKILPGQKYKGIVFEKIVPVMIPMLLGSFFISLSVGGTIIYVLKWSVYT